MKAKKVLILLAVIGANVLHNMPVHTAFADNVSWYGKSGNTWTNDAGSATASGATITLTKDTTVGGSSALAVPTYFYAGYSGTADVSGNTLTLSGDSFSTSAQTVDDDATRFYGGYGGDANEHSVSGNTVKVTVSSMTAGHGYFYIVGGENHYGTASGNIVNIEGVTVGNNKLEVYGGSIGNDATGTSNNAINVSDSTFNNGRVTFVGGYSLAKVGGTLSGDSVTVTDSTFNGEAIIYGNAYGSDAAEVAVKDGKVTINRATFADAVDIEGSMSAKGTVSGGSVSITNGTFNYNGPKQNRICGSCSPPESISSVENGNVTITDSIFGDSYVEICGNRSGSGAVANGNVTFTNSVLNKGSISGSCSYGKDASGGTVSITNGTVNSAYIDIYGSNAYGLASGGAVTINSSNIYGGNHYIVGSYCSDSSSNSTGGKVTLDVVKFKDVTGDITILGGKASASGVASGNAVVIKNVSFENVTDGKKFLIAAGRGNEVTGNTLTIDGGDFSNLPELGIYAADPSIGEATAASDNTVTINGGKFAATQSYICVGTASGTNNTLNINTCVDGTITQISDFQNINFTAPNGMDTASTMLSLTNTISLSGVSVGVDISNISLSADEFITLIDNVDGTGYSPADAHYQVLSYSDAAGTHSILIYSGNTDPINPDYKVINGATTKTGNLKATYNDTVNGTDLTDKITDNEMTVSGGTYKSEVYGAGAIKETGEHEVSNNIANIKGGTFISENLRKSFDWYFDTVKIAGGYGNSSGDASITVTNNTLNILGGEFTRSDIHDYYLAGGILDNEVADATLVASGNTLNVSGGTFNTEDGEFINFSGTYVYSKCKAENVTITGGTVVFGAENSKISVTEDSWATIYGARFGEPYSDVESTNVTISNNNVSIVSDTDKTSKITVYGGFTWDCEHFTADNNVVNIGKSDGSTVFENMKFSEIYGAYAVYGVNDKTLNGNTLNLNAKISVTDVVNGFQKMNFTFPAGFGESDVMMTVDGTVNFDNTVVDINDSLPDGFVVVKGSKITLISANELSGNCSAGTNISNLGTLNKQDNKLYISLLDGPIVAKDLTVDVQVNSDDALVLIGNDADNILAKTISGEGGVQIGNGTDAAEVKTSADNLTVTGDIKLMKNATLTITDGELQQNVFIDIKGGEKINMESGSSFGVNTTISANEVNLGSGVEFSNGNLFDIVTLNLNDAVYNLSATLDGSSIEINPIDANNVNGTLSLGNITLSGSALAAGTYQASYIKDYGNATSIVNGTSAVIYGDQTYIFSQGYTTPGDSGSGEIAGTLDILVENKAYTLKEIINGDDGATFDPAKIATYVMTDNYTANDNLGILGKASDAPSRTLTIDGGDEYKLLGDGHYGIEVNAGDTLTLQNITEISGWDTYAVDNSGTANFAGTITLGTDAAMQGDGNYNNNGTLTTSANNLKMTELANNGTLILTDGTITTKITGTGTITVKGEITAYFASSVNDSTGTLTVSENSILELENETLNKAINNEGTVKLNGAGLGSACVTTGTMEFAHDLETKADYVAADTNIVDEGVTLTLTGGSLAKEVTGAGGITFYDVSADVDNIKTTGENTVSSGNTLTLTSDGTGEDTLTVVIGGHGSIVFAGDITTEAGNIQTTDGATVSTTGSLHLSGGNLETIIGGAGDIYIDGDVSSEAGNLQGDKMTVSDSSTLTLTNGELDKAVTNNGTVKLDGATLNGAYVTDGTLEFAQDLEISADYVAADANVVDDGATLTLKDGNLAEEVTGAGGITFNGDISANADKIKTTGTNKVESGKTLTLTDGTLGSKITNAGTIKLEGATLGGKYVTDGTLEFAADLSINADYIAAATNQVDDGVILTCSTGSLTSNITNSGTVDMASGSSFGDGGKITGGAVTLGDGVEFTESNFDNITSLALDNAVYNLSATVVDGGVTVSQLPSCATGTITLGEITIDGANYDSWEEGDYKQIQFADLSTDNLTVSGSQEAILDGYVYTFSQAYTIAGDSSSGIKYGYFDVVKEIAETRTLKEVIAQDDGDIKYSLRADENVDGTIELRDSSADNPRTLTIKNSGGNTYEIIAENSDAVLKNNNSDTLTLEKVTVSGFDTAIENATADGTVNLKSVTFENTGTTDVVNDGTLNILDGNVVFDKGVTGTGTMNVKDNLTVGANTTIEQNTINVDAGKTLTNNGTITINDGSLNGDGVTPLTNAGTVVINNGNLNTIVDGGVLEFDGTSSVAKPEYISGDTNNVLSNASLTLANADGELKAILDGDGEVIIDSAIDATNGGINTKVTINADKSLKINADNLGNEATNNGTLTLIGGTGDDGAVLNNAVSGSGTTVISGGASGNELTVTAKDAITTSGGITVEQYNTLQISASNIGANVTNNGTIKLAGDLGGDGETLSYSINGGAVEIVSGTYDFTDITNLNTANTITLKDGTVTMDAEDLFTSDYAGKTDFGGKFTAEGGTLCLNNFDNKETFTTEELQKATDLIDNPNVVVMIDAELATGEGEELVIKGTDDGNGNVTLSGVPVVADTSGGASPDINVPAVPKNYVPVTDERAENLLSADTITVDGGKFVTKGLQIDNLNSGSTLDLVIQGTGTDVTFTGGDGETGVVKKNTDEKVKVDLAVKDGAVFNAGINAGTDRGEFTFESVTIEHAKMNICSSTVETPELTIGDGGWLVVDPGYFKATTMNIMGGAIQVIADGSVYNQGYEENELRAIVEDAGIGTSKIAEGGFIATSDIGIMAVRTNKGGNNVTLDKNNGTHGDHLAITSDSSYDPNIDSTPMLRIDDNALLILDGSRLMSNTGNGVIHLLNSTADDVVISNKASVYVAGVSKKGVGIYKMITGPGVDKDADYFGNNFKTDNTLYKVVLLEPDERIENTFAFKIMWNEENTVFSSENLGVSRGAYDVATAVTGAIAEHFYDKELGEKLWATYVHDKDKIDGLKVGSVGAKYDFQFNGTLIGYDFLTEKDTTAGVAFGYINGNTNGFGHNDSKYYDLTAYGRKTVDGINLLGNISYLHGKNETSMVLDGEDVNATAKTNTYTIGVTADKPYAWGNGNISPFAGLHYLRIGGKDYTNGVGMKFKADTINTFVLPLGVKYDMEVNNFYGWKVKPTIMAGYMWNLGDKDSTLHVKNDRLTSSYGYDLTDKRAFFTKAGLQFVKKNVSVGVGYDYMKSSRSHNNRWSVNLSWSF